MEDSERLSYLALPKRGRNVNQVGVVRDLWNDLRRHSKRLSKIPQRASEVKLSLNIKAQEAEKKKAEEWVSTYASRMAAHRENALQDSDSTENLCNREARVASPSGPLPPRQVPLTQTASVATPVRRRPKGDGIDIPSYIVQLQAEDMDERLQSARKPFDETIATAMAISVEDLSVGLGMAVSATGAPAPAQQLQQLPPQQQLQQQSAAAVTTPLGYSEAPRMVEFAASIQSSLGNTGGTAVTAAESLGDGCVAGHATGREGASSRPQKVSRGCTQRGVGGAADATLVKQEQDNEKRAMLGGCGVLHTFQKKPLHSLTREYGGAPIENKRGGSLNPKPAWSNKVADQAVCEGQSGKSSASAADKELRPTSSSSHHKGEKVPIVPVVELIPRHQPSDMFWEKSVKIVCASQVGAFDGKGMSIRDEITPKICHELGSTTLKSHAGGHVQAFERACTAMLNAGNPTTGRIRCKYTEAAETETADVIACSHQADSGSAAAKRRPRSSPSGQGKGGIEAFSLLAAREAAMSPAPLTGDLGIVQAEPGRSGSPTICESRGPPTTREPTAFFVHDKLTRKVPLSPRCAHSGRRQQSAMSQSAAEKAAAAVTRAMTREMLKERELQAMQSAAIAAQRNVFTDGISATQTGPLPKKAGALAALLR
eukprot:gnl/TRDRNA2_/TRDRNA2_186460_c0_seq1.p1 gnl/TRDRNA2_/TRDRNA2_186460_c0~~gnl/TRDRNA2_/TRDRNA2_186460_c0_seq1.p1  ORF type:complete len:656 (-),score=128.50 gnl/TRDRNA2_/TRDRNA2_186460_c0_seq1:209-2176(-)